MWDQVINVLAEPWLRGLAAVGSLLYVLYRFRYAMLRFTTKVGIKARGILENARLWIVSRLGVVTREEIVDLRETLENRINLLESRLPQPSKRDEDSGYPDIKATPTVERLGMKITLGSTTSRYLGKVDPSRVGDTDIDYIIQGPFCRECLRSLVYDRGHDAGKWVAAQCPKCDTKTALKNDVYCKTAKKELYERLDAEFRKSGKIDPIDGFSKKS